MNELITSKKKPQKLQIVQHFFGFQLAGAAPVWQRAVNRQPGSRSDTRRAGAPLQRILRNFEIFRFFRNFDQKLNFSKQLGTCRTFHLRYHFSI